MHDWPHRFSVCIHFAWFSSVLDSKWHVCYNQNEKQTLYSRTGHYNLQAKQCQCHFDISMCACVFFSSCCVWAVDARAKCQEICSHQHKLNAKHEKITDQLHRSMFNAHLKKYIKRGIYIFSIYLNESAQMLEILFPLNKFEHFPILSPVLFYFFNRLVCMRIHYASPLQYFFIVLGIYTFPSLFLVSTEDVIFFSVHFIRRSACLFMIVSKSIFHIHAVSQINMTNNK